MRRRDTMHHGTLSGAARHAASRAGVVFPASGRPVVVAGLGAACFVAVGAAMLVGGGPLLGMVGGLAVLVFGCFLVLTVRFVAAPRGGIVLMPEGVFCRVPGGTAWVPWRAMDAVWLYVDRQPVIAMRARHAEALVLTGPNRWLHRVNRRWYGMDVGVPARALRLPPEQVVAVLQGYLADPAARAGLADPAETERSSLAGG